MEYAYRSGSIEPGFRTTASLAEGTRIHQKVQKQYSETGGLVVEEIKSTSESLDKMGEGRPVHWAQALMYAYMISVEENLPAIEVRLTYVQSGSEEQRSLNRTLYMEELTAFAAETVSRYARYAELLLRHNIRKDNSIRDLTFPFPSYRQGQRHFAGAVYKSVSESVNLFAQAPTGIGKTISTLFPVIKAMGEGQARMLFYLTAKTVTRLAAEEAISLLLSQGLWLHAITITAKEKACFREEGLCTKEYCPFADGYYDRINEALLDLLGQETLMTRDTIARYARKHSVCPFELSDTGVILLADDRFLHHPYRQLMPEEWRHYRVWK
ncbi:hypothetical protein PaeBR_22610 [Paenibacillus sp. BR2-3]|uniref:hypothetical protein n=1 Tax=Paenibacillus sp. BR2-3 TaxID=3048494 RepID=UPI0039779FC5